MMTDYLVVPLFLTLAQMPSRIMKTSPPGPFPCRFACRVARLTVPVTQPDVEIADPALKELKEEDSS
ncbi:hypothetical protein JTE90_017733 [Oedothorax gibbosus]|uniref:Uncharacterized protein n=1 Tax=Oedothorax gibbosus TaxID=931172 RepID=A0AAV6UCP2_9ARAC|nr:hypothetical protein JTE90_017733 [Oedothorax gibbosus]